MLHHRYGPGDQGAINHFYEAAIKHHRLHWSFNTKPYHAWNPEAKIVHFHGPKPHDFLHYVETGNCAFQDYCQTGLMNGFCLFATEWASFIADETLGRQTMSACLLLESAGAGLLSDDAARHQEPLHVMLHENAGRISRKSGAGQPIQYR